MYDIGYQLGKETNISKGKQVELLNLLKSDVEAFRNEMFTHFINAGQQIPDQFLSTNQTQLYEFMTGFYNGTLENS